MAEAVFFGRGSIKMRAVYFKDQTISWINPARPKPKPGQVLLRPLLAGICNTDLELLRGYHTFTGVPGHEFVALVEKAPGRPDLMGKRVVCDINIGCGRCSWCAAGDPRHCDSRRVIGILRWQGAFAEYLLAPAANVHVVDDRISDEEAVFAEPLAAALEISQQIRITAGQKTAVLGDGKLGLLIALSLAHYNPGLLLVGKHAKKLALARRQGVAVYHLKSMESYQDLAKEQGPFDLVIEATGRAEGINFALGLVRPEGTIVVKTTSHEPSSIDLAKVAVDEINIIGSRCGDMDLALAFLRNKWVKVKPLIQAVYPFSQFPEALARAGRPGAKKMLLRF